MTDDEINLFKIIITRLGQGNTLCTEGNLSWNVDFKVLLGMLNDIASIKSNVKLEPKAELEKIMIDAKEERLRPDAEVEYENKELKAELKKLKILLYRKPVLLQELKSELEKTKTELQELKKWHNPMSEEEEIQLACIRAKEGAKKHAEAKKRLQELYDARPMISFDSVGETLI